MVVAKANSSSSPYCIFDLDGTLLDYEGASHIALQRVLDQFSVKFTHELHASIIGTKDVDWSRKIISHLELENVLQPNDLVKQYHEHIHELIPHMQLMPGAEQLLRELRAKNIPIAIATSSSSSVVPRKLSHHPVLMECVDAVVTGDDPMVKLGKPAPDIFLEAAKRLGCGEESIGRCIVFEDSPFGAMGGVAAGMRTIAIPDKRYVTDLSVFPQEAEILTSLKEFALITD